MKMARLAPSYLLGGFGLLAQKEKYLLFKVENEEQKCLQQNY